MIPINKSITIHKEVCMQRSNLNTIKPGRFYYSDIPANFAKSIVNNDIATSYDFKAIQESLTGIITTKKGAKPFNPLFGCDITVQLFENIGAASAFSIKYNIEEAVKTWEPRITLTEVIVTPVYEQNTYDIAIHYHLKTNLDRTFAFKSQLDGGLYDN